MFDFFKRKKTPSTYPDFPKPLLHQERKLAVLFSGKSGCTFVAKWFFYQVDLLDTALEYDDFIHRYRKDVYNPSADFKAAEAHFLQRKGKDYLTIKVIRNPFERAVSSYIHFLGMLHSKHRHIPRDFGISYDILDYSFEDFLTMLKQTDIGKCNIHWRRQFQQTEMLFDLDYLIPLENSIEVLQQIETTHQLKKSNQLEAFTKSIHHSKAAKTSDSNFCGQTKFNHRVRLKRPPYPDFYNQNLEKMVVDIYKKDFDHYNLSTTYLSI